jgi:DNA/RNA-binding domain of Phe-tRNA-synthetase-like protein
MFEVSDQFRQLYPGAAAGFLVMGGVVNPATHPALDQLRTQTQQELRERYAGKDRSALLSLPHVQANAAYYRRFDKTYHVILQLESVALKAKPIPRVSTLIEAMFIAELKNQLLTAGHDLAAVRPPVTVGVALGSERYTTLNGRDQVLKAGDMFMADCEGVISNVLYGPDRRTRITPETSAVLFAVYAPAGVGETAVREHLEDIRAGVLLIAPEARTEALVVEPSA